MERPYVILNLAQSLNGYISGPHGRRVLLSSDEDWNRVMGMRRSVDGILIGKNTVIHDDPELKLNDDSPAIRIVIDPKLSLEGKNYRWHEEDGNPERDKGRYRWNQQISSFP